MCSRVFITLSEGSVYTWKLFMKIWFIKFKLLEWTPHGQLLTWKWDSGTSLVVQWLRLLTLNAGDPGSTPGQGTRSHMSQWTVQRFQLEDPECQNKDLVQRNKSVFQKKKEMVRISSDELFLNSFKGKCWSLFEMNTICF